MNGLEAINKMIYDIEHMSDAEFVALYDSVSTDADFVISSCETYVQTRIEFEGITETSVISNFIGSDMNGIARLQQTFIKGTDSLTVSNDLLLAA